MARAHDQLNTEQWSAVSLKGLLTIEFAAYLDQNSERFVIEGDDVLIAPKAVSTLALVFHELVTNSVKYGALSALKGRVEIKMFRNDVGALELEWRETGGPAVQAPADRGFGSAIIERSIPFELKGVVQTRYKMSGLEVGIIIPEIHCRNATAEPAIGGGGQISARKKALSMPKEVLLVEDNLVISMQAEDMITALGAETVHVANSVQSAMKILDTETVQLGVLDVNLGEENSLPVVRRLQDAGIPYILATGYGSIMDWGPEFPAVPVLKKPYSSGILRQKIEQALDLAEAGPEE